MSDPKFLAFYPSGTGLESGGYALLKDGTLVRVHVTKKSTGGGKPTIFAINEVTFVDNRPPSTPVKAPRVSARFIGND